MARDRLPLYHLHPVIGIFPIHVPQGGRVFQKTGHFPENVLPVYRHGVQLFHGSRIGDDSLGQCGPAVILDPYPNTVARFENMIEQVSGLLPVMPFVGVMVAVCIHKIFLFLLNGLADLVTVHQDGDFRTLQALHLLPVTL